MYQPENPFPKHKRGGIAVVIERKLCSNITTDCKTMWIGSLPMFFLDCINWKKFNIDFSCVLGNKEIRYEY